jgi:hypothetical protein
MKQANISLGVNNEVVRITVCLKSAPPPMGRDQFEELREYGRIILNWMLQK